MVYRSDNPPQSKDEKNRRERERYGGIADLIMQIRQELGISVKFHAPILVNCLETITRLQEENAKLDMDIAAAKKIQRDRKQMGIGGGMDPSGQFGHGPLAPGQGILPNSLPLLQQNQFLALQNAVPGSLGPNKALSQIPQGGGFAMQPQQPLQGVTSPAPSPRYRERREENDEQAQNIEQQNPSSSLFPPSTSSFSLPGGQGPPPVLPPHGAPPQTPNNRPTPLSPGYLPQTREEMGISQTPSTHQQQPQAPNSAQEGGQYVNIHQQHLAGPKMEYGAQIQQSAAGKILHQNLPMRQRQAPYPTHPGKPQLPQYHSQQQNIYQMNQDSNVFASPGQNNHTNSGNINGNNMAIQQQIQQQQQIPLKVENNIHQTHDLPSENRPPSSASEGFFSSFEDSNNQSMFSELNNTQPSVDLGHSETFQSDDFSLEQIFST